MPPTLLPEESPTGPQNHLTSSKKWLVQVGLLFGLLLLGRESRPVPAQLAVTSFATLAPATGPAPRPAAPALLPVAVGRSGPMNALPVRFSDVASAAFLEIGL